MIVSLKRERLHVTGSLALRKIESRKSLLCSNREYIEFSVDLLCDSTFVATVGHSYAMMKYGELLRRLSNYMKNRESLIEEQRKFDEIVSDITANGCSVSIDGCDLIINRVADGALALGDRVTK